MHVQAKTVGSWIDTPWLWHYSSIIGSQGIGNTGAKSFQQELVVTGDYAASLVHVMLSEWHLCAQLECFIILVFDWYLVGLVTCCPYDKICLFQMFSLFINGGSFHQFDPILLAFYDPLVHAFCITSQSSERVEEAILVGELMLFKVLVSFLHCSFHPSIENLNFVPVKNLNIARLKVYPIILIIEAPLLILEESKAFADAGTFRLVFAFRFVHILTHTAPSAFVHCFENCIWEVIFAFSIIVIGTSWLFM